jgi:hypothetical protein
MELYIVIYLVLITIIYLSNTKYYLQYFINITYIINHYCLYQTIRILILMYINIRFEGSLRAEEIIFSIRLVQ